MNFMKGTRWYQSFRKISRNRRGINTGEVRFLRCVSGNTLGSDEGIIRKLKEGIPGLREESNVENCDVILAFCSVVSRFGTNIQSALEKLQDLPETKATALVVLHHTIDLELRVPDSSKSVDRENTLTVDCLFQEGRGLLQCQKNQAALEKIISWVKKRDEPQKARTDRFRRSREPAPNPTSTQIKQLQHELQKKDDVIRQLQHEVQKKDEVLQQQQHELQKKDKVFQQQQHELQKKDDVIRQLQHEVQKKDEVLQQQQHELQKKDEVLQQQQHELQKKEEILWQQQHELQRKDKVLRMVTNKLRTIIKNDHRNQRQKQVEDLRKLLNEVEKLKNTYKEETTEEETKDKSTQTPDTYEEMFNCDSRNTILETEKREPGTSSLNKKHKDEECRNPEHRELLSKPLKQQIVQTEKKDERTPLPETKKHSFNRNRPDLSEAGASTPTQQHKRQQRFKKTAAHAIQEGPSNEVHSMQWDSQTPLRKQVEPSNQMNNKHPDPPYQNKPLRRKKVILNTKFTKL